MDYLCYFCLVLLCFHARLFADVSKGAKIRNRYNQVPHLTPDTYGKVTNSQFALWSPTGKGLTSWLSFVMSNCDVFTFPLVPCIES